MPKSRFLKLSLLIILVFSMVPMNPASASQGDEPIVIHVYDCPAGTLPADDLATICTDPAPDIEFWLGTIDEDAGLTTSDAEGTASFASVEPGYYAINETVPDGYAQPFVTCIFTRGGVATQEERQDLYLGSQIRFEYAEGDLVECSWYNLLDDGAETGTGDGPDIEVQARLCTPVTSIPESSSLTDAEEICPYIYYEYAEFEIVFEDDLVGSAFADTDGVIFFDDLPVSETSMTYGVFATLREDESTLAVYCEVASGDGDFATVTPQRTEISRIDYDLLAGDTMHCVWFIESDLEPALFSEGRSDVVPGIGITAKLCPSDVAADEENFATACDSPGPDIAFDVTIDEGSVFSNITGEDGTIEVPRNAGTSDYLIKPLPTTGYLPAEYECTTVRANGFTERMSGPIFEGSLGYSFEFDGTSSVTCIFYFLVDHEEATPAAGASSEDVPSYADDVVPGGPYSSLSVSVSICDDPADIDASLEDLKLACKFNFDLSSWDLNGEQELERNSNNWPVVELGELTLSNLTPGQNGNTVAYCTISSFQGPPQDPVRYSTDVGTIVLETEVSSLVFCEWFVFPG